MRNAALYAFLLSCATATVLNDDAAVMRAVVSDSHFQEWRSCDEGTYVLLKEPGPPAWENDKPYFWERPDDSPPPALLDALRARNATRIESSHFTGPRIWFSLPGYDPATNRAAVSVARSTFGSCLAAGYIVILQKRGGVWRVESRTTEWVE